MASRLVNETPKWIVMVLWIGINIFLFVYFFIFYFSDDQFLYVRSYVGLALPIARGCASPLNFNCMLILLPVCRNLLSFIRGSMKCCKRSLGRPLDKNIAFHKCVAYAICFWTAVHVCGHCFNAEYFVNSWDPEYNNQSGQVTLLTTLNYLNESYNESYINPVRSANQDPIAVVLSWFPGVTGVIITLALVIMVTSATDTIRRSYFEVFWYTHHLFIVFFAGLVIHGLFGVVRTQTNIDINNPLTCSSQPLSWKNDSSECGIPTFTSSTPQTWRWVIAPMVFYCIERCIRFWRSQQKTVLTKVVKHPSKVIELQMRKKDFKMESGQYIFLHCPKVSRLEWHPFTLTSSPDENYFSVHIRLVGDWTNALAKACHIDGNGSNQEVEALPSIAVDGPFGTASEDVFRYDVNVLVGTGIGVTPFASVLKDIWYKKSTSNDEVFRKLKKVYFFWICPDTNAFEWFSDLLHELELKMMEHGLADFLSYNIFLTRGWSASMAKNIALHSGSIHDPVTGLQQKTQYGRPNWEEIFTKITDSHENTRVGVFYCGSKVLSSQLHRLCNAYSSSNPAETQFVFNKENF